MTKPASSADTLAFEEEVDLYGKTVDSIEIDVEALEFNTKGTIIFHKGATGDQTFFPIERLPKIALAPDAEEGDDAAPMAEFALQEQIGEGGMGVILRGIQLPLQREVAIKQLHPGEQPHAVQLALLREAWITGALQHPNIVPVHALGCLPDGAPMFAMKRIVGVGWDKIMRDDKHPIRRESEKDHLAWNLEILMQVCNAVHFAHAKGILHRDLKPENVMLGDFGEVYLLDWGIAVSMRDDDALPLPQARDVKKVMGTPAYMAPEMATCQAAQLSVRTDVYLLGAILHEVLTGHPKHLGSELMEVLFSAATSAAYEYPSSIPPTLAAICSKATHRDPAMRHQSADELRKELAHFLLCRTSIDLSNQAQSAMAQLEAGNKANMAHELVYALFHEAQYGFRQALRIWDDNIEARAGIEALMLHMAMYEIAQEDPKAAALHLTSLEAPPEELRVALAALEQQRADKAAQFERLEQSERERDLTVGRRTRAFVSLIMAIVFLPFFLSFGRWLQWFEYTHAYHIGTVFGFSVMITSFGLWARDTMRKTAANRKIMQALIAFCVILWGHAFNAWMLGLPPTQALMQFSLLASLFFCMWGTFIDVRMYWPALVLLLVYVCSTLWPSLLFEFVGFGDFLALSLVAAIWRPPTLIRSPEERAAWKKSLMEERAQSKCRTGESG